MTAMLPYLGRRRLPLAEKLRRLQWGLVLLITLISGVGFVMLYSAADGNLRPWAARQMTRFALAFVPMIGVALIDIGRWFRAAYWIYALALLLVAAVDLRGIVGMGAQRWIDFGVIQLQPSDVMTIALVLALARYFHGLAVENAGRIAPLLVPALLILVPTTLLLKQPDLGTAMILLAEGVILFFLGGVRLRLIAAGGLAAMVAAPLTWSLLRDYQKNRVYTFLNPDGDRLGAGYHILQSKIAFGSGGLFGKGFLGGTQSHLSFLPEKQTDFIFTMVAEEFGFVGGITLLALYLLVILYAFAIALRSRNQFGRLLGLGIAGNFSLYLLINTAMVMGLIPVVGVPLPLVSYGGTAMVTVTWGFGLLMSIGIHRDARIGRPGEADNC